MEMHSSGRAFYSLAGNKFSLHIIHSIKLTFAFEDFFCLSGELEPCKRRFLVSKTNIHFMQKIIKHYKHMAVFYSKWNLSCLQNNYIYFNGLLCKNHMLRNKMNICPKEQSSKT